MAINQFLIFVLPRKPIEEKYGLIPKQLEINHAEWEKYWENYDIELNEAPEPDFEDARTFKWWKDVSVDRNYLEQKIDKFISRTDWGEIEDLNWKSEKSDFDHDVSIDFDFELNYIQEFQFRTDLNDPTLTFLKSMLDLCDRNDWILMDDKGNLSEPNIKSLAKLIKDSDANGFLRNRTEFFNKKT